MSWLQTLVNCGGRLRSWAPVALLAVLAVGLLCPEAAATPKRKWFVKALQPLKAGTRSHSWGCISKTTSGKRAVLLAGGSGTTAVTNPGGMNKNDSGPASKAASAFLNSAELYDPESGPMGTGPLHEARADHAGALLPSGQALVAGGLSDDYLKSAELYDPDTGTWSYTGNLNTARGFHTATLLDTGQVLAAGGENFLDNELKSAEIYDPASKTWSPTGDLKDARSGHTATLLPGGRVLAAGGFSLGTGPLKSAEIYDPANKTWSPTGDLIGARTWHAATGLANGNVLVAGGTYYFTGSLASAAIFNANTWVWYVTGDLNVARSNHTLVPLPDGTVMAIGGWNENGEVKKVELYDPDTGAWDVICSLITPRQALWAALWDHSPYDQFSVIVMGGSHNGEALDSVELIYSVPYRDLSGPLLPLVLD